MHGLAAIAASEIGTREVGGNNTGPRVREYQSATWLEPGPWPWCAAFTAWCLREWLIQPQGHQYLGKHLAVQWRCKDASAFGWEKWALLKRLQVLPETELALSGDLAVFDFSHIGIVAVDQTPGRSIETIEGNTNGLGQRDSESGDGVWRKTRKPSLVKCFIRLGDRAP